MLQQYLCPPGNGVFTVNTAKDKKQALHQAMYQHTDLAQVEQFYFQQLQQFLGADNKHLALLGICSDAGGGIQRGANWGPLFIRERLIQKQVSYHDLGDIRVIPHLLHDKYLNQETLSQCRQALYSGQNQQLAVSPLSITEAVLTELYERKRSLTLFALGGDHSVSYPLVKCYLAAKAKQSKKCALIHFDAHTDLLHSRLGIDLCFGSWLTHVLPKFACPSHVVQFGIRSSAKDKQYWQAEFGIQQFWMNEIKQLGIELLCQQVIDYFKQQGIDELYISFDIDALDERIASATGTPEPNGLSVEDVLIAISLLKAYFPVTGADLVEVAPMVNPNFKTNEPETTLLAAERIALALLRALEE